MKFKFIHFCFVLFVLLFCNKNSFAKWTNSGSLSRVHQVDGPVEANDLNQKILKIVMSSTAPVGTSTISALTFSLTGNAEIGSIKIVYTTAANDSNFANATNQFGATITNPGPSPSFSGSYTVPTASGLFYFWLVMDAKAAIANGVVIDASLISFTGGSVPNWENGATPINPTGFRFTSRNYLIGSTVAEQYPTVKATADAISRFDYDDADDIFMEMTANYANPVETPIIFRNHTGPATITIRPESGQTGKITAGDPGSGIYFIGFSAGVQKIILDGRPSGLGTLREWTIRNTRSTSIIAGAIAFVDAASANTLAFLNIEAANTVEGIVAFSISSGATGNNNNTLSNCLIKPTAIGLGATITGVYSSGTAGKNNSGNTIDNCEFSNILANSAGSSHISIVANSDSWNITNNSFYNTTNFSGVTNSYSIISIAAGSGYTISGNFIGGKAKNCGGAALSISSSSDLSAIFFSTSISGTNNVNANTISNISYTTNMTTATFPFVAIALQGPASYICGTSGNGNLIGGNAGANNIILTNNNDASGSFGFVGINQNASGTHSIAHNTFSGIIVNGTKAAATTHLINNLNGTTTVDNNTFGTLLNNISVSSNSDLFIIRNAAANGITCTNNTIDAISHNASTAGFGGIINVTGNLTATGNTFQNITSSSNSSNGAFFMINHQPSGAGTADIQNNTIQDINLTSTGTTVKFFGLSINTATSGNICNNNTIGNTINNNITLDNNAPNYAIYHSLGGSLTCNNNTIQEFNLTSAGTSASFSAINNASGVGTLSATGNIIKNIDCASSYAGLALIGINNASTATGHIIDNNTIINNNLTNTGVITQWNMGVYSSTGNGNITKNFISGLTMASTSTSAEIDGLDVSAGNWDVFNNVVLLDNSLNTNSVKINGIYLGGSGTVKTHHNTVKIDGTIVAGTAGTNAIYSANSGPKDINNNIFQNKRTGTGIHAAFHLANTATLITDYNFLEVANNQSQLCYYISDNDFSQWNTNTVASGNKNSAITLDAIGKVTTDPFPGAGTGTNLTATVPDDKLDITRGIASWMGAFEGPNITTSAISPLEYCAGGAIGVSYTVGGGESFNGGNIFTAQLSNSAGDFSSPTNIGTLASTTSGTIAANIPGGTPEGTGYRIRVVSSDPVVTGSDNGANINIANTLPATPSADPATGITCSGFTANWTASPNATIYYLDVATDAAFTVFVPGYNNLDVGNVTSYSVSGLIAGTTYYYRVRAANGCGTSANSGSQSATTTGAQRVLVVSSAANGTTTDGVSLRWAITEANNNCGHDSIHFGFGAGGPFTISLTAALPPITGAEGVTIDGFNNSWCALTGTVATDGTTSVTGTSTSFTTEITIGSLININGEKRVVATIPSNVSLTVTTAFSLTAASQKAFKECASPNNGTPNTVAVFDATASPVNPMNPVYKIILGNGGTVPTGLIINSGSNNNNIRGLVLQDFGDATSSANDIAITVSGNDNKVLGCYIGIGSDGVTGGTQTFIGISVSGANNQIGDGTAAGANLISGANSFGLNITGASATGNSVRGNMVGLQKDGSTLVAGGQSDGIILNTSATLNTIGGSSAGDGNVISGQGSSGVYLNSAGDGSNTIAGNIIGPQADGVSFVTGNTQANGIWIFNSNNNIIGGNTAIERNIISANETAGIAMPQTSTGNIIKGNYIGIDKNGTSFITGSTQDYGIRIWEASNSNIIGGSSAGEGNVISGNMDAVSSGKGISLESTHTAGNTVLGNIIGPQADGITYVLSNVQAYGINIQDSPNNTIGGNTAGARNIISANENYGVFITGASSTGNVVKGNYIGIAQNGTSFIAGSTQDYGVAFNSSSGDANTIGGSGAGEGNVISGNSNGGTAGRGIIFLSTAAAGNSVLGNIIGPQADGITYLANVQYRGIEINGSPNNTIGGNTTEARNIISANENYGVYITGAGSTGNIVKGNYIGIDKNGTTFITGSNQDYGVFVTTSAASNIIGGSSAGEGNVISGNNDGSAAGVGIYVNSTTAPGNTILGNTIGPQADGLTYLASNPQGTGISITNSPNNTIGGSTAGERNIISANGDVGVYIANAGSTGNVVKGNYIGIDKNGTNFITGSTQDYGVYIDFSAASNTIGGSGDGEGNVISGNKDGVSTGTGIFLTITGAAGNTILGNIIGPQADGITYLASNAQYYGIYNDSPNNTIGGNTAGARNIISANETYGIYISGAGATGNVVKGNYIGPSSSLTNITSSNQDYGVYITLSAASNTIGSTAAGEANEIAFNIANGININGAATTGNVISANPIYSNTGKPIELNYGPSQANNGIAVPLISTATATTVSGTSGATDVIEVFKNTTGDCFDAATYVGSATAVAGAWSLTGLSLVASEYVLATARDGSNNTSEFSACSQVNVDLYWIGGNGAWNNPSNWSYISGGAACTCIPDINSNVFIDNNSGTNTITMPVGTWYTKNFTMSGAGAKSSIVGQGSLLPRP